MGGKTFHWQYPGEEENRILNADDYNLVEEKDCTMHPWWLTLSRINVELTQNKCEPDTKHCKTEWKFKSNGSYTTFSPRKGLPAPINSENTKIELYSGNFPSNYELIKTFNTVSEIQEYEDFFGDYRLYRKIVYKNADGNFKEVIAGAEYGIRFDYFGVSPTYEPHCKTNCRFEIYKNNKVVYDKVKDVCPEVWTHQKQNCPPNTCPVACGNCICCYSDEGVSKMQILKKNYAF